MILFSCFTWMIDLDTWTKKLNLLCLTYFFKFWKNFLRSKYMYSARYIQSVILRRSYSDAHCRQRSFLIIIFTSVSSASVMCSKARARMHGRLYHCLTTNYITELTRMSAYVSVFQANLLWPSCEETVQLIEFIAYHIFFGFNFFPISDIVSRIKLIILESAFLYQASN